MSKSRIHETIRQPPVRLTVFAPDFLLYQHRFQLALRLDPHIITFLDSHAQHTIHRHHCVFPSYSRFFLCLSAR